MDDIHIPCIVWFHGDPPPDLSQFSDPIRIPFTFLPHRNAAAPGPNAIVSATLTELCLTERPNQGIPAVVAHLTGAMRATSAPVEDRAMPLGRSDGYSNGQRIALPSAGGTAATLTLTLGGPGLESIRTPPASANDRVSAPANSSVANVGYLTTDAGAAAQGLGMSSAEFRRAIHALKDAAGLGGADNVRIHVPSGDVYFNDERIGNLRDE